MAYTFKKRVGPTKYSQVKNLTYYAARGALNPFEVNSATGGNCTWWAWGRFLEVMAVAGRSLKWKYGGGNACAFYKIMTNGGLEGGLTPKPGAIICWGYDGASQGNPGHVAFVESVKVAKGEIISIEVSQSGWSSGPMRNQTLYPGNGKRGTSAWKLGYRNSYFNGFIYNPVDFGNPAGVISGGAGEETKSKSWYISKYGTGAEVYFELQKYGYSHKACCAVLGNMQQESGIRVYTGGSYDGNGSEGLCQWTFGRKTAMQQYAAAHSASKSWKSVDGQVAYLVYELEHSEKKANAILKNESLSLDKMTEEFEKAFERAGAPNMAARKKYAHEWDEKMSGADGAIDSGSAVNMAQRISKLYSSDNYEYVSEDTDALFEKQRVFNDYRDKLRGYISQTSFSPITVSTGAFPEHIVGSGPEARTKEHIIRTPSKFSLSDALVQAPFVELNIGGYIVGSYKSATDDYPNYISRLDIKKINGEINQYIIGMVYQIRPGEDPNLLDELLSKVRYDKIHIRYGDCESGALFKDTEAIITNVVNNRDYASSRITYTIYATSACNYVTSAKFNFKATTDKPSNVIRDLIYNNPETSQLILDAFPGMRNITEVESKNYIPTNDSVLNIAAKSNQNIISYINYLVGCMSNNTNSINNVIRNSSYFITYNDDINGAYFSITELSKSNGASVPTNNLFEVTVGYPDGNDIYDFTVNNNEAWSILYDVGHVSDEYIYGLNNAGDTTLQYSPNIVGSSNILNEIQKNWWTQMTTFPISAQLSMRGLLKPVSLMDYIQVDVRFYGQKHITSGLYAVIGQQDILSGSGFLTNLSLLRVGD